MAKEPVIQTDESGRQFIDMTPSWTEILPTWRFAVEQVTTRDKQQPGKDPNLVMQNFWAEMKKMAEAADKWNNYCQSMKHVDLQELESGK